MSEKTKAIVIKSEDRKDKDVSVLLFSLEQGKFWAILRGAKNPKSKLRAAKEVFSFGDFVLEEGKSGKIITAFDLVEDFHEITLDIDKFYEGCAILEVISKLEFPTEYERSQVFVLALKCLKNLCFNHVRNLYVLDKFLISTFEIYGSKLYADKCTCCGNRIFKTLFIDYTVGTLVCVSCKSFSSEELSPATYSALRLLTNMELDRLQSLKLAGGSEKLLLKILVRNFEVRFDCLVNFVGILS